jgi:hypothetical protein
MKTFADILRSEFGEDTPIFTHEITTLFPDISEVALFKRINKALVAGDLKRESRGVYYSPKTVKVLGKTRQKPLDPMVVLRKKYLSSGDEVYGYFSGLKLENDSGISQQVPAMLEIITNKESARRRSLGPYAGYRDIVVKQARTPVTKDNVAALEALDLIDYAPIEALESYQMDMLKKKVAQAGRDKIISCLEFYPARTSKKLLESERYGLFA